MHAFWQTIIIALNYYGGKELKQYSLNICLALINRLENKRWKASDVMLNK